MCGLGLRCAVFRTRGVVVAATLALVCMPFAAPARGATAFVDFETNPKLSGQPSLFADAGPAQTIAVPDVATFTGGVVLGDETNLPAQSFGTAPDVYGTASASFIPGTDPSLKDDLTITANAALPLTEVSFPLFNGYTSMQGYTVDAFDGSTQVAQQMLTLMANTASGYGIVDLKASAITSVVVMPDDITNGWDFSIDSVAFNEPVSSAVTPGGTIIPPTTSTGTGSTGTGSTGTGSTGGTPPAVPLPAAAGPMAALLGAIGLIGLLKAKLRSAPAVIR